MVGIDAVTPRATEEFSLGVADNTYGELTFGSTSQVVKRLREILLQANENPSKQIIAELGSGYGGYVAGLVTCLDCKAFGIENTPDYYKGSISSLADAVSKGIVTPGKLAHVHVDLSNRVIRRPQHCISPVT